MYFKITKNVGSCCFEYYNRENRQMEVCGEKTSIEIGKNQYICKKCLIEAMARFPRARLFGSTGEEIFSREFFLATAGVSVPEPKQPEKGAAHV